jgi:hypothetical protein
VAAPYAIKPATQASALSTDADPFIPRRQPHAHQGPRATRATAGCGRSARGTAPTPAGTPAAEKSILRIVAWNIKRGFIRKEAEIKDLAESENIDIISLSETDLVFLSEPPAFEGFKTISTLRSGPLQKVRLLTLVKESLSSQVTVRTDLMSDKFPSVWLEINGFLVCSFYREWVDHQDEKMDIFLRQIHTASSSKKSLLIMGDCNLDQQKWDNPKYDHFKLSEQLRTGLAQDGLEVLPMGVTYLADHRSKDGSIAHSALDHIYSSINKPVTTKVLSSSASDHMPIMAEVDLKKTARKEISITKRCFKTFNSEAFQRDLSLQDFSSFANFENVDDMVVALEAMINCVLDFHAPFKQITLKPSFRSGLSNETKKMMKKRNRLQTKMKKLSGDEKFQMHLQYRKQRNRCVRLQKRDTINNNVKRFCEFSNPQDVWKAAKAIISPRTQTDLQVTVGNDLIQDEASVAKVFNDFFVAKVETLRNSIDTTNLPGPLGKSKNVNKCQFILTRVSDNQVLRAINKLKTKPSTGLDQISSKVLKAGGEVLAIPLCYIINNSITSGKFPSRWKESKVIPLHKKGDAKDVKNYRPVSNLCVISKVLEMIVHDQISRHCDKEGLIPRSQHGFQKGKSTLTATISMFDTWQQAMEDGKSTGVLLFDLSAAFDTLDHRILEGKLSSLNFSPHSIKWVSSFLQGRTQKVMVGKTLSPEIHISVGVPQGGVLSPLLFLLYVSDIEDWIQSAAVHSYADDTTLTVSSKDMSSLLQNLEREAERVLQFMAVNKLVANPAKTSFILIRGKDHKKWPETSIKIGNSSVKESVSEKVLGVTVNNKLKWQDHHNNIVSILRHKVFVLRRLTYHLPRWVLVSLLDGMVLSSVRYCLPLWGSIRLSEDVSVSQWSKRLQVQINNALRVTLGVKRDDHVSVKELHEKTGCLTFNQLVIQATHRLTASILKGDSKGLDKFYYTEEDEEQMTTRATKKGLLKTPSVKNIQPQGFRIQSTKLWNSLSEDNRNVKMTTQEMRKYPL